MNTVKSLMIILVFSFACCENSYAQRSKFPDEAGLLLGACSYAGDIVKTGDYDYGIPGVSVGAFYRYYFNNSFNVRVSAAQGTLRGNDYRWENTDRIGRGFNFKTPLTELSVKFEFDLLNHRRRVGNNTFRKVVSPFFFAGGGVAFIKPQTNYNPSNNAQLRAFIESDQQNTPRTVFTVPVGAGLRYDLHERVLIGLEASLNPVFNDYLDGISESGNPVNNDWYASAMISLTYRFDDVLSRKLMFR